MGENSPIFFTLWRRGYRSRRSGVSILPSITGLTTSRISCSYPSSCPTCSSPCTPTMVNYPSFRQPDQPLIPTSSSLTVQNLKIKDQRGSYRPILWRNRCIVRPFRLLHPPAQLPTPRHSCAASKMPRDTSRNTSVSRTPSTHIITKAEGAHRHGRPLVDQILPRSLSDWSRCTTHTRVCSQDPHISNPPHVTF